MAEREATVWGEIPARGFGVISSWCRWPALALILVLGGTAAAQTDAPGGNTAVASGEEVVRYPASFFERYQPESALDMVQQVPGFQIDDGENLRGFSGAAGNILINDRRPTVKQDAPSQILARIPAMQVERIELIRGNVRGIDLRGQTVVANVILREDLPATLRWEVFGRYNFEIKPHITAEGRLTLSDRWHGIDYNTGVYLQRNSNGDPGTEVVLDGDGTLLETRIEGNRDQGPRGGGNFNASTVLGDNLVHFNSNFYYQDEQSDRDSLRTPVVPGRTAEDKLIDIDLNLLQVEVGGDVERLLRDDLIGKAIVLFYREDQDQVETEQNLDAADNLDLLRVADTDTRTTEAIGRLEFDWAGWAGHAVQANFELAYNALDNALLQTEDAGAGPVVVDVPGANTRVEETRGDILFKDTWSLGELELDYGLGAEVSTISQSGDADLTRHFFFLKPQALLTWSPDRRQQTRLRLQREVAQLDFKDFVSATVFLDDDLALGNPNLRPETTWVAELSHERRFGDLGVVTLTLFHHWISDVQDLLPITGKFEAPGNIGNGRRWGALLEATLPLGWTGLTGARLDLRGRWQKSRVTDPVTGRKRVLSDAGRFGTSPGFNDENEWALDISFRQDFEAWRSAWGWSVRARAERPVFKVDELNIYDDGTELNFFIETTRWWGLKIRLEGLNVLNHIETRDRAVYVDRRGLSPVDYREVTSAYNGTRILLRLIGTF